MLDGAARLGELFDETERLGMPALATTDHGYLFGAFDFWRKATDKGIKPIIGVEAYVTPGTARGDKSRVRWGEENQRKDDVSGGGSYTHMTLLSYNNVGMRNLFRASSIASLDSVFGKWPRLDRELLNTYSEGLIATTGCPSGEVQTRLRLGQYREALEAAAEFRDIFGAENYFCELMDHGLDIERRVTGDLLRLAKDLNLPLVATNDLHYTHEHDAKAHEALLAIQSGSTLLEPTYDNGGSRFAFSGSGYYLKSPQEMRELFRDHPEACDNTLLIAERCEVSFNTGANYMPRFPCPEGRTRRPGSSRKWTRDSITAIPRESRTRSASRPTMSWKSSLPWASRATSSWWPTSSTGPRTTASGWVPDVARVQAPWLLTPCASPTWIRSTTA